MVANLHHVNVSESDDEGEIKSSSKPYKLLIGLVASILPFHAIFTTF